ncbi:hypothetical protein EKO27_g4766 [Xylaria grammica]|uniref:Uncharacterized protein n=1 Tax=Xylaria grammica TaxID=363999 RepID=A0A439D7F2_9PEZI|nr:hypothetical protein EKO27_g4766 [Xylaria grammica]
MRRKKTPGTQHTSQQNSPTLDSSTYDMPNVNNDNSRASSATRSTTPGQWLPYQGEPVMTTKSIQGRFIDTYRDRDWFVQLAMLMEPLDQTQSKLFLKFYFFLRDFMPYGLIGNDNDDSSFGHILGNDVMNFLLCQGEHTVSRHKVTKNAEFAFLELEKWMGRGKTWREALQQAQETESDKQRKRRAGWKAPGLHTPAGLLAVLVLAHPDPDSKFRNWVGRLEIDWMIRPRNTLAVKHGFWEGISTDNIYDVFAAEEPRAPQFRFLADYTVLFSQFEACQSDIRPFVQDWARKISLEAPRQSPALVGNSHAAEPSTEADTISGHPPDSNASGGCDMSSDQDLAGGERDKTGAAEPTHALDSLRMQLTSYSEGCDLQQWLFDKLLENKDGEVLSYWCYYWQGRIDAVKNLQDQLITRSLFEQSLQRLKSLYSDASVAEAYMLLDKADEALAVPITDTREFLQSIQAIESCHKWLEARADLRALVGTGTSHIKDIEKRLAAHQACFLYDLMRLSPFHDHWSNVMAFDTKRIRVAVEDARRPVPQKDQQWWRDSTHLLFNEETIRMLKLTNWQLVMLFSGSCDPLTAVQARVFRQKFVPEAQQDAADFSIFTPKSVVPDRISNDAIHSQHGSLYKLFGQVEEFGLPTPVPSTPTELEGSSRTLSRISREPSPPPKRPRTPFKKNVFAGRVHVPAKRAYSPDQPADKSLKLLTKADLLEELAAARAYCEPQLRVIDDQLKGLTNNMGHMVTHTNFHNALELQKQAFLKKFTPFKADIQAALESHKDEVTGAIQEQSASYVESVASRFKVDMQFALSSEGEKIADRQSSHLAQQDKSLATIKDDVGRIIQEAVQEHFATLKQDLGQSIQKETQKQFEKIQPLINDLLPLKREVEEVLSTKLQGVQKEITELKTLVAKAQALPSEGEHGYLSLKCPAPSGTQPEYDGQLLRAAWFYINALGNPEGGVCADEETLELTKFKFPSLEERHIVIALHHVHQQAYGCELRYHLDIC